MAHGNDRARVLLTGTFDLDNFGDLLFALISERYFRAAEVRFGAPFGWDMTGIIDQRIEAYGPLLDTQEFDIIWTAGGELGGGIESAFYVSAPQELYDSYLCSAPWNREAIIEGYAGGVPLTNPYIPSPIVHPRNAGTIQVINSIGMSSILDTRSRIITPRLRGGNIEILRNASLISVRDKRTSQLFDLLGIEHRLAPDLVHAISFHEPCDRNLSSDTLIFQISTDEVDRFGLEDIARIIIDSESAYRFRIRVMVTGTSRRRNMIEISRELVHYIRRNLRSVDIDFVEDRDPLQLVEHIRSAAVVVGTSLHLRIVASSYHIPRVNFENAKVDRYAAFWDAQMPYGVTLPKFDEAVRVALSKEGDGEVIAQSNHLSKLAQENMEFLVERALEMSSSESFEEKLNRMRVRRRLQRTS